MATNKLLWSSKLIGVFFIMLVCTLSANAQFLRTSYFMEGTHYRQQLNPALTPTKGYFNLPVIGAVNATVGSTSLGYQDIIDIIDDGDDFYTKPDFMNRLKDNNIQSPNQKIPDRKTKCVIKTHINIKQNVIFGAKLKPV